MITFITEKSYMYKKQSLKLVFFALLTAICLISCKKNNDVSEGTVLEKFFESSVLNKNIVVNYANDNGEDITGDYSDYTFVLLKTDYYHGPLKVSGNADVITGSWSSNEDYSKLIITLPSVPPEFIFLSRSWRFTSKTTTLMKLAPWGSTEPLLLYMQLQ